MGPIATVEEGEASVAVMTRGRRMERVYVEAATARTLPDPEPGYVGPESGALDGEGNELD